MTQTDKPDLAALADKVEQSGGPDRELDADIAEQCFGWKLAKVGADYDGENECHILTKNGELVDRFSYPPRGVIPRYFHVPKYTRDCCEIELPKDSIRQHYVRWIRAKAEAKS